MTSAVEAMWEMARGTHHAYFKKLEYFVNAGLTHILSDKNEGGSYFPWESIKCVNYSIYKT